MLWCFMDLETEFRVSQYTRSYETWMGSGMYGFNCTFLFGQFNRLRRMIWCFRSIQRAWGLPTESHDPPIVQLSLRWAFPPRYCFQLCQFSLGQSKGAVGHSIDWSASSSKWRCRPPNHVWYPYERRCVSRNAWAKGKHRVHWPLASFLIDYWLDSYTHSGLCLCGASLPVQLLNYRALPPVQSKAPRKLSGPRGRGWLLWA